MGDVTPDVGHDPLRPNVPPHRARAIAEAEHLLWRLDAALANAGVPEDDKLRVLAFYAWQEAHARNAS